MFLPCFRIKITSKHINNVSLSIEVMNYGDTQSNKINLNCQKVSTDFLHVSNVPC